MEFNDIKPLAEAGAGWLFAVFLAWLAFRGLRAGAQWVQEFVTGTAWPRIEAFLSRIEDALSRIGGAQVAHEEAERVRHAETMALQREMIAKLDACQLRCLAKE